MKITDCRKEVRSFAIAMEKTLQLNDYKGGWSRMADEEIIARILEETGEIITAKACITGNNPEQECIDVANFAMMLWDNLRIRLTPQPNKDG